MNPSVPRRSAVLGAVGALAAATLTVAEPASANPKSGADHQAPHQLRHNKRIAVAFLDLAFNKKDPQAAVNRYVGPKFIQHNPLAADGKAAFVAFVTAWTAQVPELKFDFKRVFAENDLVLVHHKRTLSSTDRGSAVMDIFRFENGKIVEHWDVIQDIPETPANDNTMF